MTATKKQAMVAPPAIGAINQALFVSPSSTSSAATMSLSAPSNASSPSEKGAGVGASSTTAATGDDVGSPNVGIPVGGTKEEGSAEGDTVGALEMVGVEDGAVDVVGDAEGAAEAEGAADTVGNADTVG
eukprot:scaffold21700_cov164-Amphora_coffeaeformis.AAC.5